MDIVPREALRGAEKFIQKSSSNLVIQTAGGLRDATDEVVLTTKSLEEKALRPIVMESSPAALSAGWRCMELGYEFQWKPYSLPFIITPSGRHVTLRVDNYVPVLDVEMYTIMPKDTVSSIFSALVRAKRNSHEPEVDAPSAGSAGAGGRRPSSASRGK